MMAINCLQARSIDRRTLHFKYISPEALTDIIRKATRSDKISVGNPNVYQENDFLKYPIAWSKYMETLTGLYIEQDIRPVYLKLVMHANTTLFKGRLIGRGGKPIGSVSRP